MNNKHPKAFQTSHQFGYKVLVLNGDLIKLFVIYTHSQSAIIFGIYKTEAHHGKTLSLINPLSKIF